MIVFRRKPGLVAYLTCGSPDPATSERAMVAAIDAGADVVELGVPFSDPLADGPVIQRASERALAHGVTLENVLAMAARIRAQRSRAGLIIFSYLNPILRFGLGRFAREARRAGIDGALVTDLTVEESDEYRAVMQAQGLATVFLAAPTSPDDRLRKIAAASSGFLYAVSRTGITGTQHQADLLGETQTLVRRVRKFTRLPVAVGFGISTRAQFLEVDTFSDAAVVGSALVKAMEDSPGREADAVGRCVRRLLGKD